jgi:hypothetical protein
MGLFDFFTGGKEGQLKRHARRLKNLNAQAEDRQVSAHWLAEEGSEEAVLGLLGRYEINYEQRMKDSQEKDLVFDLLRGMGAGRVGPGVRQWVRKNQAFARPLQLVEELEGTEAAVDVLLDMLGREVDPFKPEKKRQILIKLAEYRDPRIIERVPACLHDFDEGIRYAAAEALLAQEAADETVRGELAKALANRQEESNRLRVRIAEAFHQRSWSLGEHAEAVAERPPVGWTLTEGGRPVPG